MGFQVLQTLKNISATEGTLAIFYTAENESVPEEFDSNLFSMVDWYNSSGELVSLHSDQIIKPEQKKYQWTEIAIRESKSRQYYLVVLNGPAEQSENSIKIVVTFADGSTKSAVYKIASHPFL